MMAPAKPLDENADSELEGLFDAYLQKRVALDFVMKKGKFGHSKKLRDFVMVYEAELSSHPNENAWGLIREYDEKAQRYTQSKRKLGPWINYKGTQELVLFLRKIIGRSKAQPGLIDEDFADMAKREMPSLLKEMKQFEATWPYDVLKESFVRSESGLKKWGRSRRRNGRK